ncbi:MAG: protein kinase [Emcibacteraceae bacterium]|nr:protein kinase [Emcibacteraceae bacterium]
MKYEKVDKISEGAFGFIEKVVDENGHFYARKVLHKQRQRDNIYKLVKKRFFDEVTYMTNNQHPNISEIIISNVEDVRPCYIMPIAEASMRDDLEKIKEDTKLATIALYDILTGLEYVHKSGYYHRCTSSGLFGHLSP